MQTMKKTTLSLIIFALLMISCNKEEIKNTGNLKIEFQVVPKSIGILGYIREA